MSCCNCRITDKVLDQAVDVLRGGGLVAFPTESWYGLAVDPFNTNALDRLYSTKKRAAVKPILVLVENVKQLGRLIYDIPAPYPALFDVFWPGPLTLVFPALSGVPRRLTAGTGTIAIRSSSHPVAAQLISRCGQPITATSANISGFGPYITASQVVDNLGDSIDMIIDGGATPGGKGSTIVSCKNKQLVCLREGQIPFAEVQFTSRPEWTP